MDGISDLLEFLKYVLGCAYISDLKTKTYKDKAKRILNQLESNEYSFKEIQDALNYINTTLE